MNEELNDFENWVDLWDKAQKNNIFPKKEVLVSKEIPASDSAQELYWGNLYAEMENIAHPNPVAPFSYGKDSDHPKPDWTDNPLFKELEDLKKKLYEVECKVVEKDQGGKKWNTEPVEQTGGSAIPTELENLKKKIDELSDKITHSVSDKKNPESM